jgi:hypothetical protein
MATGKSVREFILGEDVVKALEVVEAQAAERAALIDDLVRPTLKYNDNHDESGRFASGPGGGGGERRGAGLTEHGWQGKKGKNGNTVYRHPDYPEEKITVTSSGRWTHSDDDGEIASGSGGQELGDHLGHYKAKRAAKEKAVSTLTKRTGPRIDHGRQDAAPRKRTRLL